MIQSDDKNYVSAKIFDFTDAIEINENIKNIDAKIRDEILKFGLVRLFQHINIHVTVLIEFYIQDFFYGFDLALHVQR
jgi:hypothetical protein